MSDKITVNDLPKSITGSMYRQNRVILCDRCGGFGFNETEELTDYHKREYTTSRSKCQRCEGDGRLIESVESLSLNLGGDKVNRVPYASFHDIVDPHGYSSQWFRYRLDLTNKNLEKKYPDLAALSYDKYDELLGKYQLIEIIKNSPE